MKGPSRLLPAHRLRHMAGIYTRCLDPPASCISEPFPPGCFDRGRLQTRQPSGNSGSTCETDSRGNDRPTLRRATPAAMTLDARLGRTRKPIISSPWSRLSPALASPFSPSPSLVSTS